MRVRKSGAWPNHAPFVRLVQTQVPRSRSAHGEAAKNITAIVDQPPMPVQRFQYLKSRNSLQDVHFAGPAVGVVATAEDVDLDKLQIFGCRLVAELMQELDLVELVIPAMQHHIEPPFLAVRLILFRERDGVGLH